MPVTANKYTLQHKGICGYEYLMQVEKESIAGMAKSKVKQISMMGTTKVGDVLNRRNITVPSMLTIYCNMIELHRLRNEIILAATETQLLASIYKQQQELCSCKNIKIELSDSISFDSLDTLESNVKTINYVDDGPASHEQIGLAIKEFDPLLLSNFNFRNPDSFKFNILTSGLEEVRAILQYQLFQKYLLLSGVRQNQLVID